METKSYPIHKLSCKIQKLQLYHLGPPEFFLSVPTQAHNDPSLGKTSPATYNKVITLFKAKNH